MTTTTPQPKTTLDPRVQAAWENYLEDLRDIQGSEYARAESEAWERLQAELFSLTDEPADEHSSIGL
ncbi:unannotated protein [freshwater metagenome]|uniref:Unannotated protein n=1 Tax=freshwater metagenome TaxID=449393 RepID=A0A6J7RJ22_9ZZZZ|nr:hypothetical protein [Actinomycetota bacterium]MSX10955.1 hypothetical protein [Actinomycetota bacterium]